MSYSRKYRLKNILLKYGILLMVGALAIGLGGIYLGWSIMIWVVALTGLMLLAAPGASPWFLLKLQRARPLDPYQFGEIYQTVDRLSRSADLPKVPKIFLVPQRSMNAFAIGSREEPVVGLTLGLIQNLDNRQIQGVLAHEISHIKNNDLFIKKIALGFGSITNGLSLIGRLLLLFLLPLYLFGMETTIPLMAIAILIFAPALNLLLQFGLSRSIEYLADHDAALLTGDPYGLASALYKIDQLSKPWWFRWNPVQTSDWLKSHPETGKRIARLKEQAGGSWQPGSYRQPEVNLFRLFKMLNA